MSVRYVVEPCGEQGGEGKAIRCIGLMDAVREFRRIGESTS